MAARTDLAIEKHASKKDGALPGVRVETQELKGARLTGIVIETPEGAAALEKPMGTYYTVETDGFPDASMLPGGPLEALVRALGALLPARGGVLVAGLGNPQITPDALGPKCAAQIFATRHLDEETRRSLSLPALREVSVLAPGVTGQTGIEAAEAVAAVAKRVRPAAVIAVDALAAAGVERLARTIQLSNAGIEPGAGVGNARRALNRETLGVPVIAVGVPTVVDAVSLAADVFGEADAARADARFASMIVTPRETDVVTDAAARLLALGINCALQPAMHAEQFLSLT